MKRISNAERAYVHAHVIPHINAIFERDHIPDAELREAALVLGRSAMLPSPQLGLDLPAPPLGFKRSESGFGSSPKGAYAGNSDPDSCVDSEGRAY